MFDCQENICNNVTSLDARSITYALASEAHNHYANRHKDGRMITRLD